MSLAPQDSTESGLHNCDFCKIQLSSGLKVEKHVNVNKSNLEADEIISCPACYTIRNADQVFSRKAVILRKSELTQVDIIKNFNNFYEKNNRQPGPTKIDPAATRLEVPLLIRDKRGTVLK